MQISGKIKVINPEQQVTASFRKRELVVTTEEQYPQHILIDFTQDKCDLLNNYHVGESVNVSINLRGREWVNPQGETRYFNQIQGWKIEKQVVSGPVSAPMPEPGSFGAQEGSNDNDPDDLPF